MNKVLIFLIIGLTAFVLLSNWGKRIMRDVFIRMGLVKVENANNLQGKIDELNSKINTVHNLMRDRSAGEFLSLNEKAVGTAKDLIFNTRKKHDNQKGIMRANLHDIYKQVMLVIVLIVVLILIVMNRGVIVNILKSILAIFGNIKDFIVKNFNDFRGGINDFNRTFGSTVFRGFNRPRFYRFN